MLPGCYQWPDTTGTALSQEIIASIREEGTPRETHRIINLLNEEEEEERNGTNTNQLVLTRAEQRTREAGALESREVVSRQEHLHVSRLLLANYVTEIQPGDRKRL